MGRLGYGDVVMAKGLWIQKARKKMERKGTVGSYGHHSEAQMKKDIAKGGKLGKKAQFALNMERIAAKRKGKKRAAHRRAPYRRK